MPQESRFGKLPIQSLLRGESMPHEDPCQALPAQDSHRSASGAPRHLNGALFVSRLTRRLGSTRESGRRAGGGGGSRPAADRSGGLSGSDRRSSKDPVWPSAVIVVDVDAEYSVELAAVQDQQPVERDLHRAQAGWAGPGPRSFANREVIDVELLYIVSHRHCIQPIRLSDWP